MGMQQATTNCTSRSFFIGFLDIYLALISAIESTRGYFKFRGKSQFKTLLCPICKNKTRIKLRADTVLEYFPLYCPKCKQEILIYVKQFNTKVIKEPDAQTQSR